MVEDRIPARPLLPRNLTARADYLVPGNPMIARPESGVGNTHPGLEFDTRALDRHFLPGLVFDFQYGVGAKLVAIDAQRLRPGHPLAVRDLDEGLFLWAVRGRFGEAPDEIRMVRLLRLDGYTVLRRIRDLERGAVSVVVGQLAEPAVIDLVLAELSAGGAMPPAERRNGALLWARIDGERATYLDEDGVIDPELLPPGEITRTMCSPWQWDFAECYCYYWASSKPDIVMGLSGERQVLNFIRDRDAPEPPAPARDWASWQKGVMSNPDLVLGWEDLPVVTSEREGAVPRVPRWPAVDAPMSLDEIADTLHDLAAIEHALCIEYLYAKYSIAAPRRPPSALRRGALGRYRAAGEVFSIAIDEMRHFRWVNEALGLLGRAPNLARATVIRSDMARRFELRALTPKTLDDFIDTEAPSSPFNSDPQQLDGLYTRTLVSLHCLGADEPMVRLRQLVKVIIDEGESHWLRFRLVKQHLTGHRPAAYLHFLGTPGEAPEPWRAAQALCDAYYDLLLQALYITFVLGRLSRGFWLSVAHQAMFALDHTAFLLSRQGFAPLFSLPPWTARSVPPFLGNARAAEPPPRRLAALFPSERELGAMMEPVFAALATVSARAPRALRHAATAQRADMERMRARIVQEYRREREQGEPPILPP
jgi:Ferritin-like